VREDVTMTTGATPEDRASVDAPPAKRPYVAPFLRHLDVEDSAGKAFHSDIETTGNATGPS
jgi:hypothetical protein